MLLAWSVHVTVLALILPSPLVGIRLPALILMRVIVIMRQCSGVQLIRARTTAPLATKCAWTRSSHL
jgi:hypothetical protein